MSPVRRNCTRPRCWSTATMRDSAGRWVCPGCGGGAPVVEVASEPEPAPVAVEPLPLPGAFACKGCGCDQHYCKGQCRRCYMIAYNGRRGWQHRDKSTYPRCSRCETRKSHTKAGKRLCNACAKSAPGGPVMRHKGDGSPFGPPRIQVDMAQAAAMLEAGATVTEIGRALGVSPTTMVRRFREAGLWPRSEAK